MSKTHSVFQAVIHGRFSLLLFFTTFLFLVLPLIPVDRMALNKGIDLFGLVILLSCLRAITQNHRFLIFMVIFSVVNVAIGGSSLFFTLSSSFQVTVLVARLIFFCLVFVSIMKYVVDKTPITSDKLAGALSAYMLIGIIWSFIYALFFIQNPNNFIFSNPLVSETHSWTVYFSFTTLTTLGYGDVIPAQPAVQNYSVMEAVFGQIFLAVVIARLVALQILHTHPKKNELSM